MPRQCSSSPQNGQAKAVLIHCAQLFCLPPKGCKTLSGISSLGSAAGARRRGGAQNHQRLRRNRANRGVHFFGADDMRGGAHLHASLALRTFDQRDFQLDGGARFEFTRSQKINAGGTYIARDKCDRNGFFNDPPLALSEAAAKAKHVAPVGVHWPHRWRALECARNGAARVSLRRVPTS